MSAIGKIIGSLVHGSQEATLALAHLNFDFSLVKVEAPPEFHGLGAALTKKRREVAEDGTSHITARKLGALFKNTLPPTPILIRQYGTRASEIAENRAVNPPASPADGIYADHVGIDGTSIWAAATSGEGAIAVHLLACMLARMFSAPEAISIWSELVEKRKSVILASAENEPLHFATLAAAKVSLSRDQLAEWDMSARSWLRTADEAKRIQQKQLMLLVRNINIPVNSCDEGTYESVIGAWKTALTLMERLLHGEPQSVQGGDLLLDAESSAYQKYQVFGDRNICQNDTLIPEAGVLSIGIERSLAQDDTGPVWSLPLSHFRYYGASYIATRFMCDDSERLTLDEFIMVCLGSLLRSWDKENTHTEELARVVAQVGSQLSSAPQPSQQTLWIRILGEAADRLLRSIDEDQRVYQRLVSLGKRRASHLLRDIPVVFGLNSIPLFLRVTGHTEGKIELMHRVALRLAKDKGIDPKHMCVVYPFRNISRNPYRHTGRKEAPRRSNFVYTTVVAQQEDSSDRDSDGLPVSPVRHARWIYYSDTEQKRLGEEYFASLKGMVPDDFRLQFAQFLEDTPAQKPEVYSESSSTPQISHGAQLSVQPETCESPESSIPSTVSYYVDRETEIQPYDFIFVAGLLHECAVYANPDLGNRPLEQKSNIASMTLDDVEWALSNHAFPIESMINSFWDQHKTFPLRLSPIREFAAVVGTYSDLPNATIALKATYRPLYDLKWAMKHRNEHIEQDIDDSFLDSPSRELRFALLVYMETGHADLHPSTFDHVVAVSSGDSIFVSAPLLLDPFESNTSSRARMRCLRGNIGRAGIALLTTPEDPLMKSSHEANWKVIGHEPFNGELLDSFKGTSLQLGFTNFKLPINTGNLGAYDMDLVFMEAIIRVNDHNGTWIGDLNILKAMKKWTRVGLPIDCLHEDGDRDVSNIPSATAIDNWDEFLDEPDGAMIFRARGNWIARLSAAVFGGQQGKRQVVIVPHHADVCWRCFHESVKRMDWSNLLLIC